MQDSNTEPKLETIEEALDTLVNESPLGNYENDNLTVEDVSPDGTSHRDLHWTLFADPDKQELKKPTLDDYAKGLFEWDVPSKNDSAVRYRTQFLWWRDRAIDGDYIRLWVRVVGLSATILSPPFRILGEEGPEGDKVGELLEIAYLTRERGNKAVKDAYEIQEDRDAKNEGRNLIDRAMRTAEIRQLIGQSVSHYGPLSAGARTAGHQRDSDALRDGRKTYND